MAEKAMLFDTTKCIACRACQVACKQWWELPATPTANRGGYENPADLSAETWNRIRFVETEQNGAVRWLFARHACMHCSKAVCVYVCPSYARGYNDLGMVTIDYERCIGCGRCVEYCPFDVPRLGADDVSPRIKLEIGTPRKTAYKCVFCKDRLQDGLAPACAKTCPTGTIKFGDRAEILSQGQARVKQLEANYSKAYLYGEKELDGLHVMFVITEEPALYGLPADPRVGTYPDFDEHTFPEWYIRALADGRLPAFPLEARPEWYLQPGLAPVASPPEPAWPVVQTRRVGGWGAPVLSGWLGLGVVGGAAALWWTIRRREKQNGEKQELKKS